MLARPCVGLPDSLCRHQHQPIGALGASNERTFSRLFDGPDYIVHERLEVSEGISNVRRLVHLGKWGIKYRDDVFQQIGGVSLKGSFIVNPGREEREPTDLEYQGDQLFSIPQS